MARKPKVRMWVIPRGEIEQMPVDAVLDMLRYDGATVESNAPQGYWLFRVVDRDPTIRRWKSFGIKTILPFDPMRHQIAADAYAEDFLGRGVWGD